MPVRQDVRGDINTPALTGYQAPGVARAQLQQSESTPVPDTSAFWGNLINRAARASQTMDEKKRAEAYLVGQQDNALGKVRQEVHGAMQQDYEEGYNRAQVGTDLAKFQMGIQQKAVEFVNSGKSPEEFDKYVQEQTSTLLTAAGSQGMDLDSKDWQAWLTGVKSTRDTATDLYSAKSVERSQYMKQQSLAAEGSASIATFQAADEAGNPMQALGNMTSHIARIYTDGTLSVQQKDGAFADYAVQALGAARSAGAVEGVSTYFQGTEQFKSLPTQTQTQIMAASQRAYETRAADESVETYGYISEVRAINDPDVLDQQYPMSTFIQNLNEAQQKHRITPATYFSQVEAENTRRLKLQAARTKSQALQNGVTLSDISTVTGDSLGVTKAAVVEQAAKANGGYSGGGFALVARGLQSGAQDITAAGIEMLQQDAQSLASIDSRTLKKDADGSPIYPETVVNSLTNIKRAYDAAVRSGNNVQAQQLVSGLPDAVGYAVRQASDANNMASVVFRRSDDLAAGRVVALPASMPKEMLGTTEDVTAGLFDTSLTQKGAARNILGIQSYVFTSKEDKANMESRLNQFNGALSEEYTSLYQQGKLPAYSGDDLKNWLVGRVASRAVRVDDGSDAGSLMILPAVANKAATFGSDDNNIIAQGLKDHVAEFKAANPGATTVQMRYDFMSNELVLSATDKDNVLLTTSEGIPANSVRESVRAVESRLTSGGQGNTVGALAVPNAGFVRFNSGNSFGIQPQVYTSAVNKLVSYEGYTDTKGFSILSEHPTTGAALNEAKYVKQPEDSPQVAANKLSMYLNDKVLPSVMSEMNNFSKLPEYLRQTVMTQLVETTYHAGNANAFGQYIQMVLDGDTLQAYNQFRESPLYKDAGPTSRRNRDRLQVLDAVSQYRLHN
jgi:hypothetical protein